MFVLFHDPALTPVVPHSLGLTKGLIGVVYAFAAPEMNGANDVVIAHELLHTLGATDKYDAASDAPAFPDGYGDPRQVPLYPQATAELMAGRRMLSATRWEQPGDLDEVVVGPATALEIRWPLRALDLTPRLAGFPSASSTSPMQPAVGREHRSRLQRDRRAVEIGESPARLGDDRGAGGDVEDVHVRFDHRIDLAGRQQMIVQEIAVAADAIRPRPRAARSAATDRPAGERLQIPGRERRRVERGDLAHATAGSPLRNAPRAALGICELAVDRRARHAEHDLAAAHERDLRGEHRVLAHERLGAVDRIDQPHALRRQRRAGRSPRRKSRALGKRASRISRIAISQRTSASVTGDLSALMRTSRLCWYSERAMSAACSAASSAAFELGEGFMALRCAGVAPR